MGFNLRKRIKLGPFFFNVSNFRFTSWGYKHGPVTRNVTHKRTTIDTPGPGSYTHHDRR